MLLDFINQYTMPTTCEYCDQPFSSKQVLKRHQKTALYCMDIQKRNGIAVEQVDYSCSCGETFTVKSNLTRHQTRCVSFRNVESNSTSIQPANNNNGTINNITNNLTSNITNNTNTNNITNNLMVVNLPSFTMNDLTPQYIIQTLTPVITREVAKQGIDAITGLIVEVLLKKDGRYCYCCTDKARKKFKMLIDENGQEITRDDPNAINLRTALSIPLQVILNPFTTESRPIKAILETYQEAKTLQLTGQNFVSALAPALPTSFEFGVDESLAKLAADFANDPEIKDQLAKADAKINANAKREEKIANLRKAGAPENIIKELCG